MFVRQENGKFGLTVPQKTGIEDAFIHTTQEKKKLPLIVIVSIATIIVILATIRTSLTITIPIHTNK